VTAKGGAIASDDVMKGAAAYVLVSATPRSCSRERQCILFGRGRAGRDVDQPECALAPSSMSDEMAPYTSTQACLTSGAYASPRQTAKVSRSAAPTAP
jgi:hypothetical protein